MYRLQNGQALKTIITSLLLVSAVWFSAAGKAHAEYTFCNKSSYAMSAAIGFVDEGKIVTRGWWRMRAGECRVVINEAIAPGRYFVYGEAIPGHNGPLRSWSGDAIMCVANESLFTLRDQESCNDDPRRQRAFFAVDVTENNNGSWRTELSDENNFTVYKAEVAGVQRLLKDVGMRIDRIDGSLGRSTQEALRAYRKKRNLGDSGLYDDALIDTLIAEANEQDAKLGFFFCNATQFPVWAAFAEPSDESAYKAAGWWRLEGSECAKVLRGQLDSSHYFVHGIIELGDKDVPLAGGTQKFCTSSVQFDVAEDTDCDTEGYEAAMFRKVEIGSEKAWTYQFTPDQFNADLVDTE